ncbi:hypothetical protein PIB30_040295 [Stylosanthes scabra]|uniref:PB1-like domain-containing protein n=1 Tax=Stylosanthes scabra TaxID=79078 RepID=A0ABU6ZD98_9FABA|nr:hypothetical protein [Stylosanthes scabra]
MVYLTLIYHHGGSLVTKDNGCVMYEVDNIDEQDRLDEDTLDVFAVRNHHYTLGYQKIAKCRWLVPRSPLETGLRDIINYQHLLEMCRLARGNNNRVDIYNEHVVSEPQVEEDVPALIQLTPNQPTMEEVPSPTTNTTTSSKGRVKIVLPKSPLKSKSPSKHQPRSGSKAVPIPTLGFRRKLAPSPHPNQHQKPRLAPRPFPNQQQQPKLAPNPNPFQNQKSKNSPSPKSHHPSLSLHQKNHPMPQKG